MLGGMYVPLYTVIVGDHECILVCHVTDVNPNEWYEHGCVSMCVGYYD